MLKERYAIQVFIIYVDKNIGISLQVDIMCQLPCWKRLNNTEPQIYYQILDLPLAV